MSRTYYGKVWNNPHITKAAYLRRLKRAAEANSSIDTIEQYKFAAKRKMAETKCIGRNVGVSILVDQRPFKKLDKENKKMETLQLIEIFKSKETHNILCDKRFISNKDMVIYTIQKLDKFLKFFNINDNTEYCEQIIKYMNIKAFSRIDPYVNNIIKEKLKKQIKSVTEVTDDDWRLYVYKHISAVYDFSTFFKTEEVKEMLTSYKKDFVKTKCQKKIYDAI